MSERISHLESIAHTNEHLLREWKKRGHRIGPAGTDGKRTWLQCRICGMELVVVNEVWQDRGQPCLTR